MANEIKPTPEQVAKWREKFEATSFDGDYGYEIYGSEYASAGYYKNRALEYKWQGYLRAMTEQSAEIAELRESQTMALDTVSAQLDLLADRWAEIERLKGALVSTKAKYEDLIYCVSQKFKDETRHQTAKRYLLSWEGRSEAVEAPKDQIKQTIRVFTVDVSGCSDCQSQLPDGADGDVAKC